MSRIILCNVPFYRLLGSKYNANSLGLAYTASVYKKLGHTVAIYNADFSDEEYVSLQDIFQNETNYLDYFENKDHPIWLEAVNKILEFEPDAVGYTCYTANIPTIKIIAEHIKKRDKNIKHIIGGPHLRIVAGNLSIGDIIEDCFGVGKGICCESEAMLFNINEKDTINSFPFPDRESFWGVTEEQKKKIDLSYIMTSRGCPYKCTFCANPQMWNRKVRFRSSDSVIAEMKEMKDKFSIRDFYILDDTFTLSSNRVKQILNRMIDEKLNITWRCNTRLDRLDDDVCQLMKESGCIEAKVGVEIGSDRVLKMIKKGETKQQMREGLGLLKKYDIPITAYLLTGFPDETDEDLKETIDFAKEIEVDRYSLSIFAPYYGSEIYYDLEKNGKIKNKPYQFFYHQLSKPIANDKISDIMLNEYFDLGKLNKK